MSVRFATRLALGAIVAAVLPVALVGWLVIDVDRQALRSRSEELLFAVSDDVAHTAAATLDEARATLTAVAAALGDDTRGSADRIATARALVTSSSLDQVAIYGADGRRVDVLAEPDAGWRAPDVLDEGMRREALRDGAATAQVERVGDGTVAPMVVPIRGAGATWFAVAPISLAPLSERLTALRDERFGDAADALAVVDGDLRFIAHADPDRVLASAAGSPLVGELDGAAIRAGVLVYRDVSGDGGASVALVRTLPGLPWAMVAHVPHARVFAPIARVRERVALAIAAAVLLAALGAILVARRTARPVARLVTLARALGERRFEQTVDVRTGDELEQLATAMTTAATQLAASDAALREEASIRADLGRYLPAALVDRIVAREQRLELGGDRRAVTVLFADVAAFSALAEREPPERVVLLLNQLFTMLTEIVFRHGGTVDKLIGDCLMAFWGAPGEQVDHAPRAVAAAIDMQRWIDVANDCWERSLGLTIHLAIGVHSGEAIVGNLGSEARMEYTCVGDTVNVAARLETLARPQQILVSGATRAAAPDAGRYAPLGSRQLPGRLTPVELYEAMV